MTFQMSHLNKAIILLSLVAACLLQIQADFFETATYAGLRFNAADFLLPVVGILVIASLYLKQSSWPVYKIAHTYYWLAGMTLALLVSLYTGTIYQGQIPHWGLYNKILGWIALLGYFLWGAWFAHNIKAIKIYKFFRIFALTAIIVGSIGSIIITLQDFHLLDGLVAYPFKGLMANRNALGFLTLSVTTVIYFYGHSSRPLLSRHAQIYFWILLPLLHVQIGSRSCWILLILQIGTFFFINKSYFIKAVAPSLALGFALVALFSALHPNFVFKQHQDVQFMQIPDLLTQFTGQLGEDKNSYISDLLRLKINTLALELWSHSPVLGTGLGTTQFEEINKFGKFLDVIDSTPIWILSETGLFGIIIFAAFFWLILFNLSRESEVQNAETRNIDYIAIGIFLTFAIMSVMHEILYTRFLWFILGIAITIPASAIKTHQQRKDLAKAEASVH